MAILATSAIDPSAGWVSFISSAGVAGAVVALFVLDKIATTSERDRLRRLEDLFVSELLPRTQEQVRLMQDVTDLLVTLREEERRRAYDRPPQRGRNV